MSDFLPKTEVNIPMGKELATFGAGCFWCIEAVFQRVKGVESVTSGYSGGFVPDPPYREVCNGTTGHAEVLQIVFDPKIVGFESLLEIFWGTHDPTTLNRQGNDVGPQYRSAIFYHSEEQRSLAVEIKLSLDQKNIFPMPIVTEITEFANFYPAENHHQDFYNQNGGQPYCQFVIKPKVDKLKRYFSDRLK